MSVHDRARRRSPRKSNPPAQQRTMQATVDTERPSISEEPAAFAPADQLEAPVIPAAVRSTAGRPARRSGARPAPEPVDYTKDYAAVRRDLRWIAIWSVLLFGAMIALKFSGLV